MDIAPLPFRSSLDQYQQQAQELLAAWQAEGRGAVDLGAAQLTIARRYDFDSWPRLAEFVEAVTHENSPVSKFEAAVEAVIEGDVATLAVLLKENPELVRARSTRVTHFDPPVHRATLLHYVAANGVEGYRQKTPKNAVRVATMLLEAGAEVDALADMYGGQHTAMSMLVSSGHPAEAGVQVALVHTLLDFGAAVEGTGSGAWTSPLMTALAFGYRDTAEALAGRGARIDTLAAASGLGRLAEARRFFPTATGEDRHRALALAAQHGHVDIVRFLLDAGEDPNRYNPKGNHGHSTPLHQAVSSGHEAVVRLLVERGARLDIRDTVYDATPLGWATYGGRKEIEEFLRAESA